MYNIIHEPTLVKDLHREYFNLVNTFHNLKRPAGFIKYFNLVIDQSPKDETHAVLDIYTTAKARWDVYELTPAFNISAVQNSLTSVQDLKGQMIESSSTITVYTIPEPRINDLIIFYDPVQSEEVLRVSNVNLQLNSAYSDPPLKWFELSLETAPLKFKSLGALNKNNHYVYDMTTEKNMLYPDYYKYTTHLEKISKVMELIDKYYCTIQDFYHYDYNIPLVTNELVYFWKKKYNNKYLRVFEKFRSPFGYWDRYGLKFNNEDEISLKNNEYDIFDFRQKIWLKYNWEYDSTKNIDALNGLDRLLTLTYLLKKEIKEE